MSAGRSARDTRPQRSLGDRAQAPGLGIGVELLARRAPGDDELGVGDLGERLDHVADPLALDEPPDAQHTPHAGAAAAAWAIGREQVEVDAARHDRELAARRAEADELEHLVGARRDDLVGAPDEVALDPEALLGRRVVVALVAALDDAERVERLHDRDAVLALSEQRGVTRHPEVGVDDVGAVGPPGLDQPIGELRHVRQELVLRHRLRRPGVDVVDDDARRHLQALGQVGVVAARVHDDLRATPRDGLRQRRDVDVLPARVDAAQRGERAGVLGHHRDPHATTSSRRSSQSARKRASE
jgi:hypothetical protein